MASTPEPPLAASTPPTAPSSATEPKTTHRPATGPHQVAFVAYPKLLFVWPLILAGFLFWPLARPDTTTAVLPAAAAQLPAQQTGDAPAASAPTPPTASASKRLEWFGWIYIWIAVLVLLTLGVDIDRNMAAFWVLLVVALWVLGMWLHDVKGFTFFGDIYRWFGRLGVQYDRNFGLALSIVLFVPYVIMIAWGHFNDRWRITHNEFEHYSFGKTDDSLGRGAKTVRTSYPDVFELLLGLAGTLIVYSASGTKELRRIPHVMFLPCVRKRLNKILETTSVTAATTEEDEEEETNV
jgi:hypothetical protein